MSGPPRRASPFAIFGLLALLLVGGTTALAIEESIAPVLGALAGVNLAALMLYGYDKWAAVRNRLRVPENLLHLVALLGGSPAALLGQQLFRHKTAKMSFRIGFWLIVAVQAALLALALWWRWHPPAWLPESLR